MKFLNLISGPRNISTAIMYSFAQRSDTIVLDEPFYAVYLARTNAEHPGKAEVLETMSSDERVVLDSIFNKDWMSRVLFIKNMAHHIEVLDKAFLNKVTNIFLIRDPKQIIASYAKVIEQPSMRDIGIEYEYELFEELRRRGDNPVVVDSGLLLQNPLGTLTVLCNAVGIGFEESMLHWPAGEKSYDGVWAPYWYTNVHRSTGFERQNSSSRSLPSHLVPLYERAAGSYEKLLSFAIRP